MTAGIAPEIIEQKRHSVAMNKHVITLALAALLLTACADDPTVNPTPTPSTSTSSSSTAAEQVLALYFVNDTPQGLRLFREFQQIAVATSRMEAAISAVIGGKSPLDPDYVTLWPKDATLESLSIDGDTAIIDLNFSALNVGAEGEQRAIDQIVWTATAAEPAIKSVRFLRSGKQVESFAGHVDTSAKFSRQLTYEALAPIWITSVNDGDTVTGTNLVFSGLAQVFEANVQWQVLKDGKVVVERFTTAGEAAPARAPWKVEVKNLPSGDYTIRAFALSPKDGSLFAEDTKRITYRAP
jgi:hypothetical protein